MTRPLHRDLIPSLVLVCGGGYALWEAATMTTFGAVFPTLAGAGMVLGGLALSLRAVFWPPQNLSAQAALSRPLVLLSALLIWAVLLPVTGFIATSIVAALIVMRIAQQDPPGLRSNLIQSSALIAMVCIIAIVFQHLLNVPLP